MFHFPTLFLVPKFAEQAAAAGNFRLVRRLWQTSTFDLATLATKHRLHLPYQVMDVFLGRCNSEIGIEAADLNEATRRLQAIRLALYSEGISPFIVPFATTHSVNEYSGINSRDSEYLRLNMPEEIREGITSETNRVEAWPVELSFQCAIIGEMLEVSPQVFSRAGEKAEEWLRIAATQPIARAFGEAVLSAPLVFPQNQSVLHMWCAVESLFPGVTAELSFRVALYMAQLAAEGPDRRGYFERVKQGYGVRSKIAHGAKQEVSGGEWKEAWGFLIDALNAIFRTGRIPKEESILDGLFGLDETVQP